MDVQRTYARLGFLILFAVNSAIVFISFYGAIWLRNKISLSPEIHQRPILLNAILFAGLCQFIFYLFDLYNFRIKPSTLSLVLGISISVLTTVVLMAVSYYFIPSLSQGRGILAFSGLLAITFISSWWLFYSWIFKRLKAVQQILIVGSSETGRTIAQEILSNPNLGYSLLGFIEEFPTPGSLNQGNGFRAGGNGSSKILSVPTIGTMGEFDEIIQSANLDQIVVALAERRKIFPLEILLECKLKGIKIYEATDFYEQLTGKIVVQGLRPSWLIFCPGFKKSKVNQVLKRILDVVMSALGLIGGAPLMLVVALLIKLESRGPIIFRQERVGKGGKTFNLYKFRSMTTDAEARTGPTWATDRDPRVTRVGRVIRKFRIDELPQLVNILKGDMSFVGPRPERPYFVETLKKEIPYYTVRLTVNPGLTGWAQVNFPYGSSKEDALEKLQYDLFYIKNLSLFLDLLIILKTLRVVLFGQGAK